MAVRNCVGMPTKGFEDKITDLIRRTRSKHRGRQKNSRQCQNEREN